MSITKKYSVKSIDAFQCKEWILFKHYAKRLPPIEYAFGLFLDSFLCGIVTYGTPMSSNLKGISKFKMLELSRLVANDNNGKNTLSFFVSQSLKMLPKPLIIVSYADIKQNHHGYIYQATNWLYTGLSAKRTDWKIKGMEHKHGATIGDMSRGKENRADYMRLKFGDDFYLEERSRKHRYFYFLGSKMDKKIMNKEMPYKIMPYPKGDNKNYDSSYKTITQSSLF